MLFTESTSSTGVDNRTLPLFVCLFYDILYSLQMPHAFDSGCFFMIKRKYFQSQKCTHRSFFILSILVLNQELYFLPKRKTVNSGKLTIVLSTFVHSLTERQWTGTIRRISTLRNTNPSTNIAILTRWGKEPRSWVKESWWFDLKCHIISGAMDAVNMSAWVSMICAEHCRCVQCRTNIAILIR